MENAILNAKNEWLEWFEIFSMTGDIEDARMVVNSWIEYNLLLEKEEEREM